ncbi:MAG: imidazolonepropionase [Cyclobacteriaceae bacterium]|jgi:imidazolonepropionase
MQEKILYGPFTQLLTMDKLPERGAMKDDQLEVLSDMCILVSDGLVLAIDKLEALSGQADQYVSFDEPTVALPGFIDSHTHICFGGSRAMDYAMRNAGQSYLEIASSGGGIWDTVTATRSCSQKELANKTAERAARHLAEGVTTIEVKSGYGLSVEQELKMLRAIKDAQKETTADLISTCLAAHVKPKDFEGDHQAYLELISTNLFPLLKEENLANRVDIFVEEGAFGQEVAKVYLEKAQSLGFDITIHADQFHIGGSALAIKMGAKSADHLEVSGSEEITKLAKSEVISTALPGASIGLGCAFTPARAILDQGGQLAIASDWNPGSAPMGDLLLQASILGTFQKLSNTEVLAGITVRAAKALGLQDRGILKPGLKADFLVFATSQYNEILYQQGKMKPANVIKNGKLVKL